MKGMARPTELFNPYEITTTGTSIMALKYANGVVLACDTRTSRGVFISDRVSLKANMISPDVSKHGHIMVLRAGTASHTQVITKYVRNYLAMHAMELQDQPIGSSPFIFRVSRKCLVSISNFFNVKISRPSDTFSKTLFTITKTFYLASSSSPTDPAFAKSTHQADSTTETTSLARGRAHLT